MDDVGFLGSMRQVDRTEICRPVSVIDMIGDISRIGTVVPMVLSIDKYNSCLLMRLHRIFPVGVPIPGEGILDLHFRCVLNGVSEGGSDLQTCSSSINKMETFVAVTVVSIQFEA